MFKTQDFGSELKKGFIFYLVSSGRPLSEMLFPNLIDQRQALENQFSGMSKLTFTYAEYENTRLLLIETIHKSLTPEDKHFLLRFEQGTPDWSFYDFRIYPAVQWKLLNIQHLKIQNPAKHSDVCSALVTKLDQLLS